ncbi:hypothetical protein HAX54_040538 [Datura stramonium]|uniref:F-box domain-containing protein n=1 Tax=Datura stramonium TaxID=4076 RepID=A0ABS8SL92_DATST|nr:hypothetical protein [Datura stramonium]
MSTVSSSPQQPPWQVLVLVSNHLDPKTLAIASCVCKSWSISMTLDQIWQPLCCSHYPSLSRLHNFTTTMDNSSSTSTVSYRRLYALGQRACNRRLKQPSKPCISLNNIIFALNIYKNSACMVSLIKHGRQLSFDKKGVFRFDIDLERRISGFATDMKNGDLGSFDTLGDVRVTWDVILEGYKGVFNVMNCKGKGRFVLGLEGWFSEELPPPGCCSSDTVSGLVADLRLGLKVEDGRAMVEKMSAGILSIPFSASPPPAAIPHHTGHHSPDGHDCLAALLVLRRFPLALTKWWAGNGIFSAYLIRLGKDINKTRRLFLSIHCFTFEGNSSTCNIKVLEVQKQKAISKPSKVQAVFEGYKTDKFSKFGRTFGSYKVLLFVGLGSLTIFIDVTPSAATANNPGAAILLYLNVLSFSRAQKKVNLVAALVRGMRVEDALLQLQVTVKRAAKTVYQVIHSARANAVHNHGFDPDRLLVAEAFLGKGLFKKRLSYHAKGKCGMMMRPECRLTVVLREITPEEEAEIAKLRATRSPLYGIGVEVPLYLVPEIIAPQILSRVG